jgi:lysine 2,3-aminomutase
LKVLRSGADLAAANLIPDSRIGEAETVAERYAVAVTPHLASLIDPADPADPRVRDQVGGREIRARSQHLQRAKWSCRQGHA